MISMTSVYRNALTKTRESDLDVGHAAYDAVISMIGVHQGTV